MSCPMKDGGRALFWGLAAGFVVAAVVAIAGARDPHHLVVIGLVASFLVACGFELVIRHLPDNRPQQIPSTATGPRSPASDIPAVIQLINRSNHAAELLWIDQNGEEQSYIVVRAGASHRQPTYVGHRWRVRIQGEISREFIAKARSSRVVISG